MSVEEGYLAVEGSGDQDSGKVSPPGSPCSSNGSNDSFISKSEPSKIVLRCQASYHSWTLILLSIAPLAMIISMIIVYHDAKVSSDRTNRAMVFLFWATLGILIIYTFVLPKRYELLTDSSVNVVSFFYTYNFTNVIAAFEDPPFEDDWENPRIKFSVNCTKRLLLQRRGGWDVLISPVDVPRFVSAVQKVAANVEGGLEEGR